MTLYRINIKDFSSFNEIRILGELFKCYSENYTSKFFIKAIGYNDSIPVVFLVDDDNNYWEFDSTGEKLCMMDKERKKEVSWRGL